MKPWEDPEFVFYTEAMQRWLGGYVPTIAAAMTAPAKGRPATEEAAQALRTSQLNGAQTHRTTPMRERYP